MRFITNSLLLLVVYGVIDQLFLEINFLEFKECANSHELRGLKNHTVLNPQAILNQNTILLSLQALFWDQNPLR